MPIVTAKAGDTLCTIAMAAGFLNCDKLRAEAANASLLNRDLKAGDLVTVPKITKKEESKATDKEHVFKKKTSPPVSIRFVHGSPNIPYRQDAAVSLLNVSNYRTTKGGANGLSAFPTDFEFQQPGHDDPDTFKVEVVDPAAGATVNVLLEAMKPIYVPDIITGELVVDHHEPFGIAERQIPALSCKKVRSKVAYRSKYLRLVVDALAADTNVADKQSRAAQTLLVSDMADGNGTGQAADNDTIEILDQQVRASYVIPRCSGSPKCTVRAQVPIGGGERQKVAISIHMIRQAVGTTPMPGITEQSCRLRLFKWWRRLYAQANLGPKLIGAITTEDPPPADTITISDPTGAAPAGVNTAGAHSTLSFTIEPAPGAPPFPVQNVAVDLNGAATPEAVADRIVAAMPANFAAEKFVNPRAFNATNQSADVTIRNTAGSRVVISNETQDDTNANFTIRVIRIVVANFLVATAGNTLSLGSGEMRRVMRQIPGEDNVLHYYVVGQLVNAANTPVARGLAVNRSTDLQGNFIPTAPLRNKVFMASEAMVATDVNPFSFPHEAGHVLGDTFHVAPKDPLVNSQMMRNGTSENNGEPESKRMNDTPVLVRYAMFDPAQPTPGAAIFSAIREVDRIRTRGAGLLRSW